MDGGLVDMAKSETSPEATPLMPEENKYPYGLRLNLDQDDLEKLNVDHSDWEIGDVFPLDILVKIVSKSSDESETGGQRCSVSLQITHIGAEEHESEDGEEEHESGYSPEHEDYNPALKKHGYLRYES